MSRADHNATVEIDGHEFMRPSFPSPRICSRCGLEQQNARPGVPCDRRHIQEAQERAPQRRARLGATS